MRDFIFMIVLSYNIILALKILLSLIRCIRNQNDEKPRERIKIEK